MAPDPDMRASMQPGCAVSAVLTTGASLVPVMVIDVPPAVGPLVGVMAVTVGAAT